MEWSFLSGLAAIVWLDVVLSGDNALVIGIAASTLRADLRRKAIIFGLALATGVRILFSGAATYLLAIPGLLVIGGAALLWVSWRLFVELRRGNHGSDHVHGDDNAPRPGEGSSLYQALVSITVADISMSIDNVLAVAAIAREHIELLVFGLALSIGLMGLGASLIVRVLLKYRWISYGGVALLVFIGAEMIYEGHGAVLALLGRWLAGGIAS